MTRSASCVCGQLSVNVTGEPERVNMCNCSACQRRSGSAFQIGAWFRDERVTAINGERRVYKRLAAEGRSVDLYFCPTCGVSVYARADLRPGWTLLHGGCFADPDFPKPTHLLFTRNRYKWVQLPPAENIFDGPANS
jgi:hypothetical protein